MKQLFFKKGAISVENIPAPLIDENSVKVEVAYSFISPGTEISGLKQTGQSLFKRALTQPANIKKFADRALTKGLSSTIGDVRSKVEMGDASGYTLSGKVLQVGQKITGIRPGDLVACAGAGIAVHAEIVVVPRNLVVKVPDDCSLKAASSVAIGAIALQGVRRADVRIGESIVVIGLGLIGQITVQLLVASGCHVIGIDPDRRRVEKALNHGMERGFNDCGPDTVTGILHDTKYLGADATIICAASESDQLVQDAMEITRKRGKVVIVGAVGLGLKRKPFYQKEIDFLISCSYGPGRYDSSYEQWGIDYPRAYVRWTENENMAEYLKLIARKRLDIESLVERTFPIENAQEAYGQLISETDKPLGVALSYPVSSEEAKQKLATQITFKPMQKSDRIAVAAVGAGSFAVGVHLPNLWP